MAVKKKTPVKKTTKKPVKKTIAKKVTKKKVKKIGGQAGRTNVTLKKDLLAALEQTLGIVTTACRLAKVNRRTHYRFLDDDEAYAAEVADIQNVTLDFAESKLHKLIRDGNIAAVIFYMKTKGRKRGYSEHIDINQTTKSVGVIVQGPEMDLETWEKLGAASLENQDQALQKLIESREIPHDN